MSYSDIMSTIATIIAFIAIPATYYNGVRVGRVNDKRKEFNAVAEPMLIILEAHIDYLKSGRKPQVISIFCGSLFPQETLSALRRRMPEKQVNEMNKQINKYLESIDGLDADGGYDSAVKNASALMNLLRLR